jgi:GNAT superfamily N-acetyltransferase
MPREAYVGATCGGAASSGILRLSMTTNANPADAGPVRPPATVRPMVRRARPADVAAMADQLCRSFFDDPVMGHVFRNEGRRNEGMRRYFTTQMRSDFLPFGGCYTTDGTLGSAIWAPAGKPLVSGLAGIANMVRVIPYVASHLMNTFTMLTLIESMHPRQPHWYLATLGTDPVAQGRGIGSALLRPVLNHCDAEGLPAYLESSKERNVPFYARHGFEVVKEVPLPGGGPTIWTMWRDPRRGGSGPDQVG